MMNDARYMSDEEFAKTLKENDAELFLSLSGIEKYNIKTGSISLAETKAGRAFDAGFIDDVEEENSSISNASADEETLEQILLSLMIIENALEKLTKKVGAIERKLGK